ncbi:MAG: tol-pal system-associated acyl-CoA thioesterase [Rhodoferax sp.]
MNAVLPQTSPGTAPEEARFHWPVRVYWEDTDAGGVVYYANYLRFFERARTEWLRQAGVGQESLRTEEGVLFVVADVHVRYLRSARLDDALDISVRVLECGAASLALAQQAHCQGALLCEATVRVGCVDAQRMRPVRLPARVRAALGL